MTRCEECGKRCRDEDIESCDTCGEPFCLDCCEVVWGSGGWVRCLSCIEKESESNE